MKLTLSFPDGRIVEFSSRNYMSLVNKAWDNHMKHPDALIKVDDEIIVKGYLYREPLSKQV